MGGGVYTLWDHTWGRRGQSLADVHEVAILRCVLEQCVVMVRETASEADKDRQGRVPQERVKSLNHNATT